MFFYYSKWLLKNQFLSKLEGYYGNMFYGTFYLIPFPLYPTWAFARHQPSSYQTYSDVKPTVRKPSIKSTILEGQTFDSSLPRYVYKQRTDFIKKLTKSSLAKSHHTLGIKSCVSWDGFNAVLDRFGQVLSQLTTKL